MADRSECASSAPVDAGMRHLRCSPYFARTRTVLRNCIATRLPGNLHLEKIFPGIIDGSSDNMHLQRLSQEQKLHAPISRLYSFSPE